MARLVETYFILKIVYWLQTMLWQNSVMRNPVTYIFSRGPREPGPALIELVDILYTTLIPVVVVACLVATIGCLMAIETKDPALAVLTGLTAVASGIRIANIVMFRRERKSNALTVRGAKEWERRYAVGSYLFAGLLGALTARALCLGHPLIPILAIGIIFGYASGLVARVSIRPLICMNSLLMSVIPTVLALIVHVNLAQSFYGRATYIVVMVLLAGFTIISFETVKHIHGSVLQSLITKRDLMALAGQDALTGLPNRIVLRSKLNEGVARLERVGSLMALHCLDLDRFKAVNDTLGHPAGDALLQSVAKRIAAILQAGDTVARLGGDEFVVIQIGIKAREEAEALARRIIRVVSEPYGLSGGRAEIGVSIGIAVAPNDGHDMELLIACADEALYSAKRSGRGMVRFFGEDSDFVGPTIARPDRNTSRPE
jgi:diguanylate cyclase (GGDEF)-like protein